MRYEEFVGNVAERGASEVQVIEGRTAIGLFRLYLGRNSNAHVDSEAWDQVSRLRRCRAVQPDNLELLGVGLLDAQVVALPCRRA
ncbi:MAG: hypothetical protein JWQ60_6470 [Pseudonocardia sp.]|nr:hypothetical protein [Pseudonocardia sp.]